MKLGITIRNWGPQSTRELLADCARIADSSGLDSLWLNDHLALPPASEPPAGLDASFSEGRVLEPLATLAWLAALTGRIRLGTAVLILPYRPPLLTAKWAATVQELSAGRLQLGCGAGWMAEEFAALGVPRSERGRRSDEALALLHRCFEADEVTSHGQPILFRPRPARPPLFIGGAPPHALRRSARFGDGWMPAGLGPEQIADTLPELERAAAEHGRERLAIVAMKTLPLAAPAEARALALAYARLGVDQLVHAQGYADAAEYEHNCRVLDREIRPALEDAG